MTTAYTSLLGLALPVTGELSGTWGDTVNNSITSLLDSAIAGTQTLTTDTTLSTTTGSANTSRQAILLCSPASANITITAPAQSKIYTVINTSATYTVTVRGAGPTTGVTIATSESAVIAWNGSDFIRISSNSTFTAPVVIEGTTTSAALRITQLGTGNALLVEDSSNPDSSPFVITASGDVGIGTSSPARRLQVSNTSGDSYIGIEASNANISGILFADPDDNNIGRLSYDHATDSLQSWTNNLERMRIDSSGNVSIGPTPPTISGLEIIRATGSASPTPAELRISTTTNAADWSITDPWGRLSFYSADPSGSGPKIHGAIDATATTTSGSTSYMQFKVNVTGSNTLRKTQEFLGGASTTSTIFYAGAEAEAMRITSAGNVLIGSSAASDTGLGGVVIPALEVIRSSTVATYPIAVIKSYSATVGAAGMLVLGHSKSATVGTEAATASGDAFGYISFEGVNSSSAVTAGAYIYGLQDAAVGATYVPGALTFWTGTNALAPAERLRIDSAGNMGLGVTPSAWSIKALQVSSTSLSSDSNDAYLTANGFFDGSWKYINNDFATQYYQVSGTHVWRYAASGTAPNVIDFKTAMTITSAGNVGIGAVNNAYNLVTENDNTTTGASQYSIAATATLSGTTFSAALLSQLRIAASTTALSAAGLRIVNPSLASGAAITDCYGIYIGDITSGTNDYGIASLVSSGTNKYNLYISGTADNYFAGDVGIGTASPAVKLDVSGQIRASTGILFGTDTAAANALDDYEEGTWTPTYAPTTGAFTSVTYDAQTSGRYTKIGNVVYLQGTLRTDAITVGTAAGGVKVGGLPFTSISSVPNASVSVGYSAAFGGDEPNGGITISNTSTIGLYYKATSNGDSVELDVTDLATGANTNYVVFQVFYTV